MNKDHYTYGKSGSEMNLNITDKEQLVRNLILQLNELLK